MVKNVKDTLEDTISLLSCSVKGENVWDEFESEPSANSLFYHFSPYAIYKIRLIGPFLPFSRIYMDKDLNISEWLSHNDFLKILRGDSDTLFKQIEILNSKKTNKHRSQDDTQSPYGYSDVNNSGYVYSYNHLLISSPNIPFLGDRKPKTQEEIIASQISFLNQLYNNEQWQHGVAVNALLRKEDQKDSINRNRQNYYYIPSWQATFASQKIKICTLTSSHINLIISAYNDENKKGNLNGLYAHDIIANKSNEGYGNISFSIEPPSPLKEDEIEYILEHKTINAKKALNIANRMTIKNKRGYLYKKIDNCDFGDEDKYIKPLMKDCKKILDGIQENKHNSAVENNLNNLPSSAINDLLSIENSIHSIEI